MQPLDTTQSYQRQVSAAAEGNRARAARAQYLGCLLHAMLGGTSLLEGAPGELLQKAHSELCNVNGVGWSV